ncbi:MAG: hypothetical protein ACI9OJ_005494 [Myxococcota bacterium]|jgi:hypothetical protein
MEAGDTCNRYERLKIIEKSSLKSNELTNFVLDNMIRRVERV